MRRKALFYKGLFLRLGNQQDNGEIKNSSKINCLAEEVLDGKEGQITVIIKDF